MVRVSLTVDNFARNSKGLQINTQGLKSKGPIGERFQAWGAGGDVKVVDILVQNKPSL